MLFLFINISLNRLTAFALRTFVQAKTFTDQVDQGMIQSGFDWLMSKNTPTGLFDNVGLVHHKNMAVSDTFCIILIAGSFYVKSGFCEGN